jgi:hypothetical protein
MLAADLTIRALGRVAVAARREHLDEILPPFELDLSVTWQPKPHPDNEERHQDSDDEIRHVRILSDP